VRRLDLVVGCNGAGKTTLVMEVIGPAVPGSLFVNADMIAAQQWPDDPMAHSYEAAAIAARLRARCIAEGRDLIAETVFSHPSKLDLIRDAHEAGYFVALHVVMVPEDLAVARVAQRVQNGGHEVPAEKVRSRWQRLWAIVADAADKADDTTFYDNSSPDGPKIIGHLIDGSPAGATAWPSWTHPALRERWP
jgi:predicted ABC-type ATPase